MSLFATIAAAALMANTPAVSRYCLKDESCRVNGDAAATCTANGNNGIARCVCSSTFSNPAGFLGACTPIGLQGTADFVVTLQWPEALCSVFTAAKAEIARALESVFGLTFDTLTARCGSLTVGAVARGVKHEKLAALPEDAIAKFNAIVASNAQEMPTLSGLGAAQGSVDANGGSCEMPRATFAMQDHKGVCHAVVCEAGSLIDPTGDSTTCRVVEAVRAADSDDDDALSASEIAGVVLGSVFFVVVVVAVVVYFTKGSAPAKTEETKQNEPTNLNLETV